MPSVVLLIAVFLAWLLLREPYWPLRAAKELGADAEAHVAGSMGFIWGRG